MWQSLKKVLVCFGEKGLILIVIPEVVEMIFYISFKVILHIISVVEMLHCSEEFGKSVSIIKVWVKRFVSSQDLNKVSHQKREHGNSSDENECTYTSFHIAPGGIVTKPNCWKGCESEVKPNDGVPYRSVVFKLVIIYKVFGVVSLQLFIPHEGLLAFLIVAWKISDNEPYQA